MSTNIEIGPLGREQLMSIPLSWAEALTATEPATPVRASWDYDGQRVVDEPEKHYEEPGAYGNTPYSRGLYDGQRLRGFASWVVDNLDHFGPFDFVAVTGKSGMSVAFAALMLRQFDLITVRKGESTHGVMVEGVTERFGRYIVVDDFVASGATLERIDRELTKAADRARTQRPEMVGVLAYAGHTSKKRIGERSVPILGSGLYID